MFKVKVNNTSYSISFAYETRRHKRYTYCFVRNDNDVTDSWYDYSKCHENDHFVKSVGRKIAFTHAIETFNRDTRKAFWEVYLLKCHV